MRPGLHSDPGGPQEPGPRVARSTIAKVLKNHGLSPAPDRPSSWRTFLRAHWGAIAGADFFTSEVWTPRWLVTDYTLFVIDLRSRRVHVAGSTPHPDAWFMAQAARRLTDPVDGFLAWHWILIGDRDAKWDGRLPPYRSGRGRAHRADTRPGAECQRLRRALRALDPGGVSRPLILFGERRLLWAVDEFVAHYHGERNHRGLGNELIKPWIHPTHGTHVRCREWLGGLLRYYHRAA